MNDPAPAKPASRYTPRLGIDIGRVIMAGDNDALFGRFGKYSEDTMLAIPEMPGAANAIGPLVLSVFGSENVWLVSKAHKNTEAKTRRWLAYHDFCARAGLQESHVWFCRERLEKAIICETLDITHFVDDRPDVLAPMAGTVPYRYLFGQQKQYPVPSGMIPVLDWVSAGRAIRANFIQHDLEKGLS